MNLLRKMASCKSAATSAAPGAGAGLEPHGYCPCLFDGLPVSGRWGAPPCVRVGVWVGVCVCVCSCVCGWVGGWVGGWGGGGVGGGGGGGGGGWGGVGGGEVVNL